MLYLAIGACVSVIFVTLAYAAFRLAGEADDAMARTQRDSLLDHLSDDEVLYIHRAMTAEGFRAVHKSGDNL